MGLTKHTPVVVRADTGLEATGTDGAAADHRRHVDRLATHRRQRSQQFATLGRTGQVGLDGFVDGFGRGRMGKSGDHEGISRVVRNQAAASARAWAAMGAMDTASRKLCEAPA